MIRSCHVLICCAAFLIFAGLGGCASGGAVIAEVNQSAPPGTGFIQRTLVEGSRVRNYQVFIPYHYNPQQRYPVIVFLHGVGEGGSDAVANIGVGLGPAIARQASTFPFIAIFPQSGSGTWQPDSEWAKDALAALDAVSRDYSVDSNRVILTGLSTGGYGTWAIGAEYHQRFAALVPMCAYAADNKDIPTLARMPIWAFHNGGDPFVFVFNTSSTCDAINKAGGHAKFTEYAAVGHDCWDAAYEDADLYKWMLQQRRNAAIAQQPAAPARGNAPAAGATASATGGAVVTAERPAAGHQVTESSGRE